MELVPFLFAYAVLNWSEVNELYNEVVRATGALVCLYTAQYDVDSGFARSM